MSDTVRRVLLVETDPQVRATIKSALEETGAFACRETDSGTDGLARLKRDEADCAVVSNDLPDMDGASFLDQLAGPTGHVTMPVVALITKEKKMTSAKLLSAGAQDCFVKTDLKPEAVVRSVRTALEIKTLSNRLQEQRNIIRAILEGNAGFLMLKDALHRYQAANPAFGRFLGRNPAELLGKTDADFFPPNEAASNRMHEENVLKSDKLEVQVQELMGKEGKRWFEIARSPLKDAAGRSVGVLCDAHDVTAAKTLEQRVQKLDEAGKDAVEKLKSDLSAAQEQARAGEAARNLLSAELEKVRAELAAAKSRSETLDGELRGVRETIQRLEAKQSETAKALVQAVDVLGKTAMVTQSMAQAIGRIISGEERVLDDALRKQLGDAARKVLELTGRPNPPASA